VKGNAIGSCCLLNEIGTETNHKCIMLCVSKIRYWSYDWGDVDSLQAGCMGFVPTGLGQSTADIFI
jgi:hypothetical protein